MVGIMKRVERRNGKEKGKGKVKKEVEERSGGKREGGK